jgi:hypothetical protein
MESEAHGRIASIDRKMARKRADFGQNCRNIVQKTSCRACHPSENLKSDRLLERHQLVDTLLSQQYAPRQDLVASLTRRQRQTELRNKLKSLHAADIAHLSGPGRQGQAGRQADRHTVLDLVREEAERYALKREGLRGDEDLFAPIWNSARERWLWLCVNLFTAFAASRVISVFEGTIEHLVALATLMPIVASIAGNTGNQTIRCSFGDSRWTRSRRVTWATWRSRRSA